MYKPQKKKRFFFKSADVKIVPFYNKAEYQTTCNNIFSEDVVKQKEAWETLRIWKTRMPVPVYIDVTYKLLTAILQDKPFNLNNETHQRSLYGICIAKCVNTLAGTTFFKYRPNDGNIIKYRPNQRDSPKLLQIPLLLSLIRRQYSHGKLPKLSTLRAGVNKAMLYLKECFWDRNIATVTDSFTIPVDRNSIAELLRQYRGAKLTEIFQGKESDQETNLPRYLAEIENSIATEGEVFIDVLLSENIFIPDTSFLEHSMTEKELLKFLGKNDFPEGEITPNFAAITIPRVPKLHKALWLPIISILHQYEYVPRFLRELVATQRQRTVPGQKLLVAWTLLILSVEDKEISGSYTHADFPAKKKPTDEEEIGIEDIFNKENGFVEEEKDFCWNDLYHLTLQNACKYTPFLLKKMQPQTTLSKSIKAYHNELVTALILDNQPHGSNCTLGCHRHVFDEKLFVKERKGMKTNSAKSLKCCEKCKKAEIYHSFENPDYLYVPFRKISFTKYDEDTAITTVMPCSLESQYNMTAEDYMDYVENLKCD